MLKKQLQTKAQNPYHHTDEWKERHSAAMSGINHPGVRKVRCLTTGEVFDYMKEACEKYNIDPSRLSKCCRGKAKSTGRHPITNEKLVWEYI